VAQGGILKRKKKKTTDHKPDQKNRQPHLGENGENKPTLNKEIRTMELYMGGRYRPQEEVKPTQKNKV